MTAQNQRCLITNATVVTMDDENRVLNTDVLVEQGTITQFTTRRQRSSLRSAAPLEVVDGSGCMLIPGLIQSHVHLCQTLFRGMAEELPLMEWLRTRIWPLEGAHTPASLHTSALLGLTEMMLAGTTTILDMGTVHHQSAIFRAMTDAGIRGFSGKAMMDKGQGVPKSLRESTAESLKRSEASYRALQRSQHNQEVPRLGYAFAPRFVLSCTTRLMKRTAELTQEYGALFHSHASEHKGESQEVQRQFGMTDIARLYQLGCLGPRTVLAHGVQLTASDRKLLSQTNTRITHCPSTNLKLASGVAKIKAMQRAGITVAIGADGAPCNNRLDPWTEIRSAGLLSQIAAPDRAQALTAKQAFALATRDGAKTLGLGKHIGSIEVGKRADLVLVEQNQLHTTPNLDLEADPYTSLVYSTTAADVRHVMVDGTWRIKNRTPTFTDTSELHRKANLHARKLQSRAGLAA